MLAIQLDERALFLARWRDVLLATLDAKAIETTRRARRCANRSREWNPRAAADASGYLQVREFHETLARRVFDALTLPAREANPGLKLKVPRQFEEAAWELVAARPVHLLDPRFKDWRAFMLDVVDESIEASQRPVPGHPARRVAGATRTPR